MDDNGAFSDAFAARKKWKPADPRLIAAIAATIPPGATVMDCGAGLGRYVHALRLAGYLVDGVDGIRNVQRLSGGLVRYLDLSLVMHWTTWDQWRRRFEWATCIEVGEHIPADRADTFIFNVANAGRRGLIISWAVPGQRGRNHVNCQPPEWVRDQFGRQGMQCDEDATDRARQIAGRGWNRKLLVFRRPA